MKCLNMNKLLVKLSSLPGIKRIVHAKMKILSSFTHPHINNDMRYEITDIKRSVSMNTTIPYI